GRALVLGREYGRVVRVVGECGLVRMLGAEAEERLDGRAAVSAAHPFAAGAPFELGRFRHVGEGLAGAQQGFDVDAVVDDGGHSHGETPVSCVWSPNFGGPPWYPPWEKGDRSIFRREK